MTSALRIIVTGLMGQYPVPGMTWHYLQYIVGLARMGHDVTYIEDSGQYPYNPEEGGLTGDPTYTCRYLSSVLARFGLEDRWAYRFPWEAKWFGLPEAARTDIVNSADLLVNVSGSLHRPLDYRSVRCLAYIDTDPVFTQLKIARGQADFRALIDAHDVHFSFGECLPAHVPQTGHVWHATRQPIVLDEWRHDLRPRDVFTTIMNWTSHADVEFEGEVYGQKDAEFDRFLELPSRVAPSALEIVVGPGKTRRTPYDLLSYRGWIVSDPAVACPDLDSYRRFIQESKAEWTVAKNGYVKGQAGWFSERSACYLAAGRPVIAQQTGFSKVLPTGSGLLAFADVDEAVDAIRDVESRYAHHARAALGLAESYFGSRRVLDRLIETSIDPDGPANGESAA